MRGRRATFAGLACFALAGVLSGCVVFQEPPKVKQIAKKPKVVVQMLVCQSSFDPEEPCQDDGNSSYFSEEGDWRVLLGFRVPKGTKAPQSFRPSTGQTAGAPSLVFSRDSSYKRELNAKAPRKANKFKYLGYSSNAFNIPDDVALQGSEMRFRVKMTVPERSVGRKFKVRPVIGSYQVSDAQPADDPIDCGSDPFESNDIPEYFDGVWRICIDSPSPDAFDNATVKIKKPKA